MTMPVTHALDTSQGLVVFHIGMTIRKPHRPDLWAPVAAAMPRMLAELHRAKDAAAAGRGPDVGFLGPARCWVRGGPGWSSTGAVWSTSTPTPTIRIRSICRPGGPSTGPPGGTRTRSGSGMRPTPCVRVEWRRSTWGVPGWDSASLRGPSPSSGGAAPPGSGWTGAADSPRPHDPRALLSQSVPGESATRAAPSTCPPRFSRRLGALGSPRVVAKLRPARNDGLYASHLSA